MTGYGQARWEGGGRLVAVELRAVNGRFFKLASRVPHELGAGEREFEKRIRQRIDRGSVDLFVKIELTGARAARPVNREALASYLRELQELGQALGVGVTLTPDALANLPGVLDSEAMASEEAAHLMGRILDALDAALDELDRMRLAEGSNLRDELLKHGAAIEGTLGQIEAEHPVAQQRQKERLIERVNRLLHDTKIVVTEQELAREIAICAERSSISEEIARLRSHVEQLREALSQSGPVGRRLEFLSQEMHREVNTMSAKVADVGLSRQIGGLHLEVDKIREQVLNVE